MNAVLSTRNLGQLAWLLMAALSVLSSDASAQSVAGPFAGLFGREPARTGREFTTVTLRSGLGGQYDDAVLSEGSNTTDSQSPRGSIAGVNAGLVLEHEGDRLHLSSRGNGAYQEFFTEEPFNAASYDASTFAIAKLATRFAFEGSATYARSPFFNLLPHSADGLSPVPEVLIPGAPFAARRLDNQSFEGIGGFSSEYSKRSTLRAAVLRRETRFFDQPDDNFQTWGARAQWRRTLTRDVALRLGYGFEEIQQRAGGGEPFKHETLDVGIEFLRELSIARRTSLSFNTETSIIRGTDRHRRYRLNGGVRLERSFRRSWSAWILANRTSEFLPGFLEPVFADNASASLGGLFTRRAEWSASLGASRGQIGFEQTGKFVQYSGNTRLAIGVTRRLGLYTQYEYYRYTLPPGSSTLVLSPTLSRQVVSAGLSVFVPIVNKVRQPRDPR